MCWGGSTFWWQLQRERKKASEGKRGANTRASAKEKERKASEQQKAKKINRDTENHKDLRGVMSMTIRLD